MRFPSDTDRLVIVGATGSGKTQAELWHLSHRRFDLMPWLVFNFKHDENIDAIPGAVHIPITQLPTGTGLYITHPTRADIREGRLEHLLETIWEKGWIGLGVDEGFMMGHSDAYRDILIQGRSKHIPMIIGAQRPSWLDSFTFTEANYWQVFRLQWEKDRDKVREFIPSEEIDKKIPEYFSHYYDVNGHELTPLRPVPSLETIHGTFARRLRRRSVAV